MLKSYSQDFFAGYIIVLGATFKLSVVDLIAISIIAMYINALLRKITPNKVRLISPSAGNVRRIYERHSTIYANVVDIRRYCRATFVNS